MNNQSIYSDGINVYATLSSRVNKGVKYVLVAVNVLLYGLFIWGVMQIPAGQMNKFIFLVFGLPMFLFFTVTRYTLWNLFGSETLIINEKSFSHKHDYGWFGLPIKTFQTQNGIRYGVQDEFFDQDKMYVSIWFQYYDENNLPQDLYTTVLRTEIEGFHKICELIDEVYDHHETMGFSVN